MNRNATRASAYCLASVLTSALLASCGCKARTDPVISWEQAAQYEGQRATVQGSVVTTKYAANIRGRPTFLNVGKSYPQTGRFTILIWGGNRRKFSHPPEQHYQGKTVRVTGKIELYREIPQIIVTDPSAMQIVK